MSRFLRGSLHQAWRWGAAEGTAATSRLLPTSASRLAPPTRNHASSTSTSTLLREGRSKPPAAAAAAQPAAQPDGASSAAAPAAAAAAAAAPQQPRRPGGKLRLDELVLQQYPQYSRNVVASWILQGKVSVDGRAVNKAGTQVSASAKVVVHAKEPKYVCRAGLKLEAALAAFDVPVEGAVALDAGLSTGGFTDCLLQNGAKQVFGIDCGINQVCHKIRSDPRVVVMEQFNLRHLLPHHLPSPVSLVTLDLSFISVLKVMPAVTRVVTPDAHLVVLIKPQFEAGREQVGSGGIVRDPAVREQVVQRISAGVEAYGWLRRGVIESPIKGDANNKGNTEYVAHFVRDAARRTAPLDETTTTDGPPSSSTGTASDDGQDEDTAGGRVAATG